MNPHEKAIAPTPPKFTIAGGDYKGELCRIVRDYRTGIVTVHMERLGFQVMLGRDNLLEVTA